MGKAEEIKTPAPAPRWFWPGVIALGGALLVAFFVTLALEDHGERPETSQVEARNQCREWARDQLVAPVDADFSEETVTGGGPWTVTGTVDAPNRFGATLRMTYDCQIRLDGDTWRGNATVTE